MVAAVHIVLPCGVLVHSDHGQAIWALTIQDMDLTIKHKPGRSNSNADALSRNIPEVNSITVEAATEPSPGELDFQAMREQQWADADLLPLLRCLTDGILPDDERLAKKLLWESRQYEMIDGVLHYENPAYPKRWCVVVPQGLRDELMEEAHGGCFAGHFV